mmetsp:Transcript_13229/g.22445  ORF Transcript_13229/g.22445 Transcript_13229/m.22445 type:complete len:158 (-) Transcript_13229:583-1056(-)
MAIENTKRSLGGFYQRLFGESFRIFMSESGSKEVLRRGYEEQGLERKNGISFDSLWDGTRSLLDWEANYILHFLPQFASVKQMREATSGIHKITQVKNTPLLVLKSENDPIVSDACIREEVVTENPMAVLVKTRYGGHLGFFDSFVTSRQFHNEPII